MIEQLPCSHCKALCCGSVAITKKRLKLIREYVRRMPITERERLAKQKRGELDCRFIDKVSHRCAIYPVRPWICEAFGRTEGMECPVVGHLVQIMPAFLVDQGFEKEGVVSYSAKQGLIECRANEKPAGHSTQWDWRSMDFK